ncbi:MAG: hybrid sensor histidine kinase/response regulator [Chloroflexota bacterium]
MNTKPKILIIDDEEVVLDSCTQILAGTSYQISTASDGTLGLKLVEEFAPDLVFVDLKMPGIQGIEVIGKIMELDPTIVTVVITGFATVSSAVEAMKNGAYDFLPKPFTPDEFRLITLRGLERRKLTLETISLRREKEMLRENFAAIVSHELKSPLGAIKQNLFLLTGDSVSNLTDEQKNRLDRMTIRIDDLIKLINSWLRVLSVDIGKIKESFAPLSVQPLIVKAIETIESHAVRKDISIDTSVEESVPKFLGEEISFVEALVNILANAVKYTHAGGKVQVNAREANNLIEITISDTGIGISAEELPFIFEDFYRGRSIQTAEGSHGIGLTISKRIIQAHDGTISVESEPGQGTTFKIGLPAHQEE